MADGGRKGKLVLWRRWEGRGGGAENTDGNYRNRNVEDEKSHTNKEQEKKITHSHVRKCTFTTKKKENAHGQTCTLSSRWMTELEIGLYAATQAACNTLLHIIS